jgi:hypothetical protein
MECYRMVVDGKLADRVDSPNGDLAWAVARAVNPNVQRIEPCKWDADRQTGDEPMHPVPIADPYRDDLVTGNG